MISGGIDIRKSEGEVSGTGAGRDEGKLIVIPGCGDPTARAISSEEAVGGEVGGKEGFELVIGDVT